MSSLLNPKTEESSVEILIWGKIAGIILPSIYKIRLGWERGGGSVRSIEKVLQYKFESCEHLF